MPVRKGHVAPQNTFIDTIIKKFDEQSRNFLIANVQVETTPIIYCNEGFCELTGFSRAEVMQKDCSCHFLHGLDTQQDNVRLLKRTIAESLERIVELWLYKKSGEVFLCSVLLAPVRNESQEIIMYILNFEDISITAADALVKKSKTPDIGMLTRLRKLARTMSSRGGRNGMMSDSVVSPEDTSSSASSCSRPLSSVGTTPGTGSIESPRSPASPFNGTASIPLRIVVESTDVSDRSSTLSSVQSPCSHDEDSRKLMDGSPAMQAVHLPSLREQRSVSVGSLVGKETYNQAQLAKLRKPLLVSDPDSRHGSVGERRESQPAKAAKSSALGVGGKVAKVLSLDVDYKMQSASIHRCTVLHYSLFKAAWDWFILVLVLYTAIVTPYVAAFVLSDENLRSKHHGLQFDDSISIVDMLVDIMFLFDIAINFRTTYVNKHDEVVSHHGKIAIHYFKGWFLIDMVAAIPFDLLLYGSETDETATLIGLLKTARLLRLVRVVRKLDRYSEYGAAVLLLLMAVFALIAHWLACIWYAIGDAERPYLENGSSLSWLAQLGHQIGQPYSRNGTNEGGPDIYSKYITALYFTFSSLTSVGFGNISPNTNSEKVFSIIVMLIGSLMYASIFGNVSAIIQRLYSSTARYHSEMGRIKEFIKFHQISNPLRQRLEEYFQHAWSYTNGIDMNMVLKGFPECLQADICLHLNKNLVTESLAFKGASPGCMRALSMRFHTTHVPPGDTLVHRGDVLNALYFISRGSIEIIRDNMIMAILGKSDAFGENVCLYKSVGKSSCNVRALTYCDLHKISRVDLIEILEMYPEFAESFEANLEVTYNLRDEELTIADPDQEDPGGHGRSRWKVLFKKLAAKTELEVDEDKKEAVDSDGETGGGGGILEFSPNRAGQDITPLNLNFPGSSGKSSSSGKPSRPSAAVGSAMTNVLSVLSLGHTARATSSVNPQSGPIRDEEDRVPLMHDSSAVPSVSSSSYQMPANGGLSSGSVSGVGGLSQSTTTTTLPFSLSSLSQDQPPPTQCSVATTPGSTTGHGSTCPTELDRRLNGLSTQLDRLESRIESDIGLILRLLTKSADDTSTSQSLKDRLSGSFKLGNATKKGPSFAVMKEDIGKGGNHGDMGGNHGDMRIDIGRDSEEE